MLNRAGHVLTRRLAAALAEVGLTPRMQCVLVHAIERERTQAELAALADLDKTTMVATADELERAGYARRVPSPADRRARIISVTKAGEEAARIGEQIVDRVHADVLADFTERERLWFVQTLGRLGNEEPVPVSSRGSDGAVRRRRQPTM